VEIVIILKYLVLQLLKFKMIYLSSKLLYLVQKKKIQFYHILNLKLIYQHMPI